MEDDQGHAKGIMLISKFNKYLYGKIDGGITPDRYIYTKFKPNPFVHFNKKIIKNIIFKVTWRTSVLKYWQQSNDNYVEPFSKQLYQI